MEIETLHHVSLRVREIERARRFYSEVMGLEEIERPPFSFGGAWFRLGDRELHLIVHEGAPAPERPEVNPNNPHLAVRVASYRGTLDHLRARGLSEDRRPDEPGSIVTRPHALTGYPQIYILDPDANLIELNAARLEG